VWLITLMIKPFDIGLWFPVSFLLKILAFRQESKRCIVCKARGISDHTALTCVFCVYLWMYIYVLLVALLRKATISFVMFVRMSDHVEQLGCHWTDFDEIWLLSIFIKYVGKIQVSLKSDKKKVYFTYRPIKIFIISRSFLHRMRNVSDKICRENQNTRSVFNNFFFSKIVPFMR
jgi:hypothetical protein